MSKRRKGKKTADQKPRIKFKPMELFRAQDAASKRVIKSMMTADGYENAISRLGLDQDNALSAGTYDFDLVTRNRLLLEMAYRGSWIVGVMIDAIAEDMTREGVSITTSEAEDKLQDFQASFSRLQIWNSLADNIKWGDLYGGAIGVLQIDGQDLKTPLRLDSVGKGQFQGIVVFDRWMVNPSLSETIDSGPDMGLPKYYQIVNDPNAYSPSQAFDFGTAYVHHSRVVRHIGIKLPFFQAITEFMWGESVLERLWDRLIAFDNATMSTASLIDRANLRTVKIDKLREIIAAGGKALDGLKSQFEMMRIAQVNEGLTLLDKEDDFAATSYSFAGLPETLLQFGQQLAGARGIPLVRLFGQSPAGLNSTGESDIRMYYDNIKAKQEATLRRPFETIIKVMWRSEYGTPAPEDLEFQFTPLWQMDAKDKAEIGKTNTDTITQAHQDGLLTTPAAMKELRGLSAETGLFSNITDEDIEEAELEPAPLPDAPDASSAETSAENNPQPGDKPVDEGSVPEQKLRVVQGGKTKDAASRDRWQEWLKWLKA
jgi:phage-related protein (TIGR01555 family)